MLGSGYLSSFVNKLNIINIEAARFLDWFQISSPDVRYAQDGMYGIPLESSRIVIAIFWLTLFALISIKEIKFSHKNVKRVTSIILGIVILILFSLFIFRGSNSIKYTGDRQSSYINNPEAQYYQNNSMAINNIKINFMSIKDEFQVEKYTMVIEANNNLKADVTVKIDNPNLSKYIFTLHHSYKINSIIDKNGSQIPFERVYDYILIEPINSIDEIRFIYKSSSQSKYFVNNQNMTLPAYHLYYPRAGFFDIWDYDLDNYAVNTKFSSSEYLVTVNAKYKVESNLDQFERNRFKGVTESLSLFGGLIEKVESEGQTYIYGPMSGQTPYFDITKANTISEKVNVITNINLPENYSDRIIFMSHIILKQSNPAEEMALFSDHIILSDIQPNPDAIIYNHLIRELKKYEISSNLKDYFIKKLLFEHDREVDKKPSHDALSIINRYEKILDRNYFDLNQEEQKFYDEGYNQYYIALDKFSNLIDYQMNSLGEEYVLRNIYKYIKAEDSSVSYVDFIYYMK